MRSLYFVFLIFLIVNCENSSKISNPGIRSGENSLSILFWNLENLFYPEDDPEKEDDEFTPEGSHHWTFNRYRDKIKGVWKTLVSVDPYKIPDIIAVCEIENSKVIHDLFIQSPFGYLGYDVIHKDSPDVRGIDVGLAYNIKKLRLLDTSFYEVERIAAESGRPTRLILSASFASAFDTVFLFVNHWPSKYGGAGLTEPLRQFAAIRLKELTDSISMSVPGAKIICTGDFNDTENSAAISLLTSGGKGNNNLHLIDPTEGEIQGTIKYQGIWQRIDHFILSDSFFDDSYGYIADSSSCKIIAKDFLLERDMSRGGVKPRRTYFGHKYNGGLSDHLPVLLELKLKK